MIDLSKPKRSYYSKENGLQFCPECGSELLKENCTIFLCIKSKSDEAGFLTNHSGSHFCRQCPVVVFERDQVEEAAKIAIRENHTVQYIIGGIVNLDAIPEEKKHLEIGGNENPLPLVRFLPDINTTTIKAEKKPLRNEPCFCGSGRKYKKCCGKILLNNESIDTKERSRKTVSTDNQKWQGYLDYSPG